MRADLQPCLSRYIGKGPISVVPIENVTAKVADEDILVTVVVIVAGANSQSIAGIADTGLLGHVCKLPAAFVSVEGVSRGSTHLGAGKGRSIEEVDIYVAIPIIIQQRQPGCDRFDDVVSPGTAVSVDELDAGLPGDIS